MLCKTEKCNFSHEFVMMQIGMTIYHASLFTYRYRNFKNIDWNIFGFTLNETSDIAFALQNGVNVSDKLKKYTEKFGVDFLSHDDVKKSFLVDLNN